MVRVRANGYAKARPMATLRPGPLATLRPGIMARVRVRANG